MSPKITPIITMLLVMTIAVLMANNNNISVTEAVDTGLVTDYCGEEHFSPEDPYGGVVSGLLQELVEITGEAYHYHNDLEVTDDNSGEVAYGHAKCSETLEPEECEECLTAAKDHLLSTCALSIYAFVELVDCDMKYDDEPIQEH